MGRKPLNNTILNESSFSNNMDIYMSIQKKYFLFFKDFILTNYVTHEKKYKNKNLFLIASEV